MRSRGFFGGGRRGSVRPSVPRSHARFPSRTPKSLVWQALRMKVHLVDGTYELFRHFFGAPPHRNADGEEVAAVRGVLSSVLQLMEEGATHVGVATDHVIESFRNDLWPGYKTGDGVDPDLWSQFWPLEDALAAMGVLVWPMVDLEADDALASGAAVADDDGAGRPGRDLHAGQGPRPVRAGQADRAARPAQESPDRRGRRRGEVRRAARLHPGLPRAGGRQRGRVSRASRAGGPNRRRAVLARWLHIEDIPRRSGRRGRSPSAARRSWRRRCARDFDHALLFKDLATLAGRPHPASATWSELRWQGPTRRIRSCLRAPRRGGALQRASTHWPRNGRADAAVVALHPTRDIRSARAR